MVRPRLGRGAQVAHPGPLPLIAGRRLAFGPVAASARLAALGVVGGFSPGDLTRLLVCAMVSLMSTTRTETTPHLTDEEVEGIAALDNATPSYVREVFAKVVAHEWEPGEEVDEDATVECILIYLTSTIR